MRAVSLLAVALVTALVVPARAFEVRRFHRGVGDVAWDATRNELYVAFGGAAGAELGNTVTALDGTALAIVPGRRLAIGSEPGRLVLEPAARLLYVGLDGSGTVRRVTLDPLAVDRDFPVLPLGNDGTLVAVDFAVLPGAPDTVAIARTGRPFGGSGEGIAVYDAGVPRPVTTQHPAGAGALAFLGAPPRLYALDSGSLVEYTIGASGIVDEEGFPFLAQGGVFDDGGRVVTGAGRVVDPVAHTILGECSGIEYSAGVAGSAAQNRLYFVVAASDAWELRIHDRTTFAHVTTVPIARIVGPLRHVTTWGSSGVAIVTSAGDLWMGADTLPPCADDAACDDGRPCTVDACVEGACTHASRVCAGEPPCGAPPTACNPERGCETGYGPDATACAADDDACTSDVCDGRGNCIHRPTTVDYEDGVRCAQKNLRSLLEATCEGRCAATLGRRLGSIGKALARVDATRSAEACKSEMKQARARTAALLRRLDALLAAGLPVTPAVERFRDVGFSLYRRADGFWCELWR